MRSSTASTDSISADLSEFTLSNQLRVTQTLHITHFVTTAATVPFISLDVCTFTIAKILLAIRWLLWSTFETQACPGLGFRLAVFGEIGLVAKGFALSNSTGRARL